MRTDTKEHAKDSEFAQKTRFWIEHRYGYHGQFKDIENSTGIALQKWRNLSYKKQGVTFEMLNAIQKLDEAAYEWIMNANSTCTTESIFDALHPIKSRIIWSIKEKWTELKQEDLCIFLQGISKNKVSSAEWMSMLYGNKEPTLEMVLAVCDARYGDVIWILYGKDVVIREEDENTEINGRLEEHIDTDDGNIPVIDKS